ncbi:MAG: hypothetical protein ONB46_11565 [candidate division KSB1 bacterium]|nr:hypothetical protein [candidate division KSB1 bacterium]MDZ7366634.1 hypothetical protein [candidate division KSB1 bacterium]MDZ7404645.1 hypothetical protein [candidate division KSB1 bacterium]
MSTSVARPSPSLQLAIEFPHGVTYRQHQQFRRHEIELAQPTL